MDKRKFGSYIKESRIKKNYTQQDLADLLFVDVTTVSKWERGVSYPDITLVPDICRVLEISEHELIASSHDIEYRKIKKDASKYNNMKKSTFWTLNISYFLAMFVCFIVNVAVSHTLSWFFIVFASLVCAYSFCPTITWIFSKYKKIVFAGSTLIGMFLLFLTCSLYTSNYWFMIATSGTLLGYFIVFYPILFKEQKKYLDDVKYAKLQRFFLLSYTLGLVALTVLMFISIYLYVSFNILIALLILGGCSMIPIVWGIFNLFDSTRILCKPVSFSLLGIIILALGFGIGRALYLRNTIVSNKYVIEESYNDIKIEGENFDISLHLSNSGNRVEYEENKKVKVELKVENNILIVKQIDNRKFYDMLFDFSDFEVDLYLSQDIINSLDIKNSAGEIDIDGGFTFNDVNISNSTGDVEFESNVSNNLNIANSTGDIDLKGSVIGGNINVKTSTGDIEIDNVKCNKLDIDISTGNTELVNTIVTSDFNMKGKTGSLKLDGFDANNIYVTVSTGDVKGSILTSKFFVAKSGTGRVSVPETRDGGECRITASTGNIIISYK